MLFLGDSVSYLATAVHGWIPPDRSFVYGFLLRLLALVPGSATPLIVAQAAASIAAALLLAWSLTAVLGISIRIAFASALAWAALEPLALLYERYLMAEALALPAFAAFTTLSLRYVQRRRLLDLVLAHGVGTFVIALRTIFVPVALAFALLLPLLAWLRRAPADDGLSVRRSVVIALLVSLGSTALLHHGYKSWNRMLGGRAVYSQADGLFLLAAWAPLLRAEDFRDPGLGARVLAQSNCSLADRHAREAQRWSGGCLVDRLARETGDERRANAIARSAALRAIQRDPFAFAALAFATWTDALDPVRVRTAMASDRGNREYPPETVELLRERLGVEDAARLHALVTPTKRLHAAAVAWIVLLSLAPFLAVGALAVSAPHQRRALLLITVLAACVIGASAVGSIGPVPRFLHPAAWLVMIPLAVLAARVGGALRQRTPGAFRVTAR
jgi:hypothetical protein